MNNTSHELIHLEVKNYYDLLMLNSQIKDKLDIIFILIKGELWKYDKNIYFEQANVISKFYSILFVLANQNKGGCCCIIFDSLLTEQSLELLVILKKYYKKILLNPTNYENNIRNKIHVICSDFQGISDVDLKKLYKMGEQIQEKNAYHNKINNNYYYVQNFIDIKSKSKIEYNKLMQNINNFNKLYLKNIHLNINLNNLIMVQLKKYENKKEKLKKLNYFINQKQLDILFDWLIKHNILKYI